MNPGYLSLILISILFILLASGWKDVILGEVSRQALLLFFALYFAGSLVHVQLFGLYISGSYAVCAGTTLYGLAKTARSHSFFYSAHLGISFVLLGCFYFLLTEITRVNPFLTLFHSELHPILWLGILSFLLVRPKHTLWVTSSAMIFGNLLVKYGHRQEFPVQLGDAMFWDQWWAAMFVAGAMSLLIRTAILGLQQVKRIRFKTNKWGDQDNGGELH
jgi:hypothetical protein